MKTIAALILVATSLCSLTAQNQFWSLKYDGSHNFESIPYGAFVQHDNSLTIFATGKDPLNISGFGKVLSQESLKGIGWLSPIFFKDFTEDYLLIGSRFSNNSNIQMNVYDPISLDTLYRFDPNLSSNTTNGYPTAIKTADQQYLLFGNEEIIKINVTKDGFTELFRIPAFASVLTSCRIEERIFVADTDGNIRAIDGDQVSPVIYAHGDKINDIIAVDTDLVFVGEKNGVNTLTRIAQSGDLIFTKDYTQKSGQAVTASFDGGYLFTGKSNDSKGYLTKVNSSGEILWTYGQLKTEGIAIHEDPYQQIYVLNLDEFNGRDTYLTKLGPNGESGSEKAYQKTLPLEVNDLKIYLGEHPFLFFDGANGTYHYPADSSTSTFFAAAFWMGGKDQNGEDRYVFDGAQQQSQMGPIGLEASFFERIWSVSHKAIAAFRNDLADGMKNEDWLLDILEWPAKGNTIYNHQGDALYIEENLAPFVDVNGNDIYEPLLGDYPEIKGDHMLWWVYNDDLERISAGTEPIQVQIIGNLFAIECDDQLAVQNTSFLDLQIENKSDNHFQDFKIGLWEDYDLGCSTDDYIGSIPDAHSSFVYNMDQEDGDNMNCNGVSFYPEDIPIQSSTFLNYPMEYCMYFNRPGFGGTHPPATTDPMTVEEHVNYMTGSWRDGTPLEKWGTGYNSFSETTNYAYDGNPADNMEWSLSQSQASISDRRIVMSTSHDNFAPGDIIDFKVAFTTFDNVQLPAPDISNIKESLINLRNISEEQALYYKLDLGADNYNYQGGLEILDAGEGATSYLWQDGSTDQTFEVVMPGVYSVTVTTKYGCMDSDEIIFDNSSGLRTVENDVNFLLFPNPASDIVNISFNAEEGSGVNEVDIDILNANGQLVLHKKTEQIDPNASLTIDLGTLVNGIYFVRCRAGEFVGTSRLVIFNTN